MLKLLSDLRREEETTQPDVLLWLYRSKIALFASTLVATAVAAAISFALPDTYHAVALLRPVIPAESQSFNPAGAALGGLAGTLLGANLHADEAAVSLAYLRSGAFARSFIEENMLLPELYPTEWDPANHRWLKGAPSLDRATALFLNRLSIVQDRDGLVTLEVTWSNAERAQVIATGLVARINQTRREQALAKAKSNFDYVSDRLQREPVQEIRATLAGLAGSELTRIMIAQGPSEYALETIGAVYAPEIPVGPRRLVIAVAGGIFGFIAGVVILILWQVVRLRQ
jgi:LPS O-antigen subunit length determinant protein (WzzB/FepE family)